MKKLSVTDITNSAQFFPKKGTLEFLQLAHRETTAATIIALIGSTYSASTMYVLYGVENTGTYPTYTVSAGAVFYNGEIYYIDAASFTATGSDVAVFSTIQSQYTTDADPCTFSDATTHNIHNIIKMQLTAGASGSALANLSAAFYLNFTIPAQYNLTAPTTGIYTGNQAIIAGSYPTQFIYVPAASNLNPALASGSENVGNLISGGTDVTVTFGTTLATSNYTVMGSIISNGTPDNDATVLWNIRSRTTAGFIVHFREDSAVTQNFAWEWIAFAK